MNEYGYKVPSHEEIVSNFYNHCLHPHCTACTFNNTKKPNALYECAIRFTKAVLSGDMCLTDSFRTDEPKPEPPVPAWCKEGAWVTGYNKHLLNHHDVMMIEEVYEDGIIKLVNNGWYVNVRHGDIAPIRFRLYTFDEAQKLLGKVMEFTDPDTKARHIHTITQVYEYEGVGGLELGLNNFSHEGLMALNATINGVPIGVPEVDEEAMGGVR